MTLLHDTCRESEAKHAMSDMHNQSFGQCWSLILTSRLDHDLTDLVMTPFLFVDSGEVLDKANKC